MHHRLRARAGKRGVDFFPIRKIALNEGGAAIDGAAMAFREIIEDRHLVGFIEKQFCANASDIAGAAQNENLHSRKFGRSLALINPKCGVQLCELTPARTWNLRRLLK